jgi:maltooligosyltrehalose trehalohydrolase
LIRDSAGGGYGLDAQWVDDFHHALHRYFTGETDGYYADFTGLNDVATALRDGYVYQGRYSVHRKRRHGRPPSGVAASQLVVSAQNHDQIGNRAQGERLSTMLSVLQLKAVAALTLLSPFVPLLFQGEEWGAGTPFLYFTDHESAELGALIAEGRSREFCAFQWKGTVPNPQDLDTFVRSKLNWSECSLPAHAELLAWYRQLIRLRGDKVVHPEENPFKSAKAMVNFDEEAGWLSLCHNGVLAVFNLSARAQRLPLPGGDWELVIRSDDMDGPIDPMPAHATFIYISGS